MYIGQRVFIIKINRKVNSKNNRYWRSRNLLAFNRVYLRDPRVWVWCAMSTYRLTWLTLFGGGGGEICELREIS